MQNRMAYGILCLCLGVLVFSLQDPLVKAVSSTYPVTQVMAIRSIIALPILVFLVHADVGLQALMSKRFGMLAVRAFIQFTSYTIYYLAIAALPLADAVALYFMVPLFIMVLAGPYLGEGSLADAHHRFDWHARCCGNAAPGCRSLRMGCIVVVGFGGALCLFATDGSQDGRYRIVNCHGILPEWRLFDWRRGGRWIVLAWRNRPRHAPEP